mgnify:CR=1 FL=1
MTSLERAEIRRLPKKYRPLGAWGYFWYNILFSIPVIGLIALIVCSASSKNIVRRGYARSYWCALVVGLIFLVAVAGVGAILIFTDVLPLETITGFFEELLASK